MTAVWASAAIAAPAARAADCAGANALPAVATMPVAQAATLCLVNGERTSRGLRALSANATLESAALAYSHTMVRLGFFAHVAPDGQTLRDRLGAYVAGAGSWAMGENLAWGTGSRATPAAIVEGWMHSPGHRAAILNGEFAEIGVGIVSGTPVGSEPASSATYTTEFGTRDVPAPAPAASPSRAAASAASPAKKPSKRVSAKRKAQISRRCHRVANRTKASKRTRQVRYDRCMRTQLRAARR